MTVIPRNLCTLVEQLRDVRRFHASAVSRRGNSMDTTATANARSLVRRYFRETESGKRVAEIAAFWWPCGDLGHNTQGIDGYAALPELASEVHRATTFLRHTIQTRAAMTPWMVMPGAVCVPRKDGRTLLNYPQPDR